MKIAKYIFIPVFFSLIISGCASSVPKQEVEIALPVEKNIAPVDSSKESQIHDSVSTTKEVISKEEPKSIGTGCDFKGKGYAPSSISYVPGVAGLITAGEVIKDLTGF